MILDVETVRSTVIAVLQAAGVPHGHAQTQCALLLDAQMRGVASHGLLRLPRVVERIRNHVCDPLAIGAHHWRASHFLEVDGQAGLGPVIAMRALDAASRKAEDSGVAVVGIRNNNHLGMLAWYADILARQGYVLIAMSTSEAVVHPWGGNRAMLGTNPIAIGVPAQPRPMVMDMATSLVSMGKIHDYAHRNEPIPAGWALDEEGRPTTDAVAAKRGAIAPFGGAKGYALGLAIEVLVTALAGSDIGRAVDGTLDSDRPCNKGDLFIVLKPQSNAALTSRIADYLEEIRHATPITPGDTVSVPGERSGARYAHALAHGVEVDDALWAKLQSLAA